MPLNRIETATETTLVVEGSARIGEAEALKAEFVSLLESSQPLVSVDLTEAEADVTCFQLLLSLQKSLEAQGRHLILRPLAEDHPVAETARLLGLPLGHHFTMVEASR